MIPILDTEQIRRADQYTIANEPIESIDLMERACLAFTSWFTELFNSDQSIAIVCGPGNNGGDGLGIARLLLERHYTVHIYIFTSSQVSKDYSENLKRLEHHKKDIFLDTTSDYQEDIIIDALFGSGLSRDIGGLYAEAIDIINETESLVVSVDMPSGIKANETSSGKIIQADFTVTFQYPKIGLLIPDNSDYTGDWVVVDIGLLPEVLDEWSLNNYLIEQEDIAGLWPIRKKFGHKKTYGHLLMAGGSYGKMGAIIMASQAALRSGVGLLTSHIPKCGYQTFQTLVPEGMASVDANEFNLSTFGAIDSYDVVCCGPGLGVSSDSLNFLQEILHKRPKGLVLDADALNLLAENRELLSLLPKNSILTPHPGEFKRLVGEWKSDFDKLEILKGFCSKYHIITVLKGAHTVTCTPSGDLYFNNTGNPGMATGGSGDVLSGMIAGILSQWKDPIYATIAAVHLHGFAGDLASLDLGEDSMLATDIIDYIPEAIQNINQ